MARSIALPLVLGLVACAPVTTAPAGIPPGLAVPAARDDTCGAAPHARLVGRDAAALEQELIMRQVRVIRPGMAMTRDFRPVRINFDIGEDDLIERIWCG